MKTYKGIVKDKKTKEYIIISGEYETKKAFIEDLKRNGYAINTLKIKTSELFDAIMEYAIDKPLGKCAWKVCKTVDDAINFEQLMEDWFKRITEIPAEQPTVETVEEQPEEIKKTLDDFFLEKDFIINDDNLQDSIFLYNIDGVVYGCDGEFERYRNTCVRGCDHNTLYSNIDNLDFIELIKKVAVIVPEIKQYYYTGQDNKIIKLLNKLNYSEVEA